MPRSVLLHTLCQPQSGLSQCHDVGEVPLGLVIAFPQSGWGGELEALEGLVVEESWPTMIEGKNGMCGDGEACDFVKKGF